MAISNTNFCGSIVAANKAIIANMSAKPNSFNIIEEVILICLYLLLFFFIIIRYVCNFVQNKKLIHVFCLDAEHLIFLEQFLLFFLCYYMHQAGLFLILNWVFQMVHFLITIQQHLLYF